MREIDVRTLVLGYMQEESKVDRHLRILRCVGRMPKAVAALPRAEEALRELFRVLPKTGEPPISVVCAIATLCRTEEVAGREESDRALISDILIGRFDPRLVERCPDTQEGVV